MGKLPDRFSGFINNRWLVFVAAMWIQSCAGIGYLFGSISPVIKSSLNYNQMQLASLGVAKDLGDSVGFFSGSLSEILPLWGALLVGAVQNLVGYGWVLLVLEMDLLRSISSTSVCAHNFDSYGGLLWVEASWHLLALSCCQTKTQALMCILIFIWNNGETYINTVALVSCVQNFPKSRDPVVGMLKGFAGLSGAILTQIYTMIHSSDHASLIFMVAVGPAMVVIALMFIVRPVGGHRQVRPSDGTSFAFCI
ncbi:hypothetical protein NC653_037858 [Populus alba x Populus x berolinensis]|uniref:Nodulin-like domain-containing protein n=1 Tax=Populus alba x Populus x berolinensis TaxID=444605 RepID=A0AAD6LF76_9ROSI|nr:hypothetical protein NC653_037858 [Populus alba x Populus x berolinensis]